jgi:hypothetical protein
MYVTYMWCVCLLFCFSLYVFRVCVYVCNACFPFEMMSERKDLFMSHLMMEDEQGP